MSGLSREFRTCCRKQQNKIQPANKKKQARIFQARKYECTFSSRRHLCFRLGRLAAQNPTLPDRQHILFRRQPANIFHFHSPATVANQSIAKCFFAASVFQTRKHEVRIWQHPKPSFPAWPANTSRCKSYYNLQQDNSFHSGASRPIPPATILSIPAPQSSISQLPSSRLGRPTPYIPSYHFFNIHKASSSHQVSLPTILLKSTNKNLSKTSSRRISVIFPDITTHHSTHLLFSIFPFSISSPTSSRSSSFRTSNSNLIPHFPNALHFFRPAAASPTRRPNAKRSFARGCSLQGCRWCGRGARVSFFSFFFYFFLLLSFLYPFSSPWRRGFAATPSFFFLLLFLFLFFLFFFLLLFLLFSFCFFLFIFLLIFYSCFFFALSFCFFFLFIFALIFVSLFFIFIFVLLLSLPSLFFLFVFLLSFYLCFSFSFLSFFLFYFFTLLTPISFLIIQPLADHSFFLFRRQSFPFHPATSRQQQK